MESVENEKLIILCSGLPARGKSFLSRKLAKFLVWLGHDSKVFSIGLYRRELIKQNVDSEFFEIDFEESSKLRENCIYRIIDDMVDYLDFKGKIGIIDGTNTRKSRRRMIEKYIEKKISESKNIRKYNFIWIESIIDSEKILSRLINTKIIIDEYKDWDYQKAIQDYKKRIEIFEKVYDPINDINDGDKISYIKFFNQGNEVESRNLRGYLPSKILSYMVNLSFCQKPIFFSRHGQSKFNEMNRIGGDSDLSVIGVNYSEKLKDFIVEYLNKGNNK